MDIVYIDGTMPYQNQIDLFYQAEVIISVHGSHLESQLFMQPGSQIIEIYPYQYYHNEQKKLGGYTGVEIHQLVNNTIPSRQEMKEYGDSKLLNYRKMCLEYAKTYPTTELCMKDQDCYRPCRSIGAKANMSDFKIALEKALTALEKRPGCKKSKR